MTDEKTSKTETKRDRVRRLLIDPLTEHGFRKPSGVSAERHAKFLTDLADELSHMHDEKLEDLRAALRYRGEGKDRRGWPCMATIMPLAEAAQPRPLEEVPALARWFRSAAGVDAYRENRLLAEFRFWERFKKPPLKDGEKRMVREKARELDSDYRVRADRERRGVASDDDLQWLAWHRRDEARAMALLPEGVA
ncbi:hypothetical protein SAMN04488105_116129 [Salipiger thiooxidans]|uniref:Uncharacterized protein n=1 Tax=Salipiger thiooxidans TaxID=282683 RepID=A0A1G7JZ33_9RHOB|nr:hypothetical protein [Salipiger thiooxidans]SDF30104.1 hypothetical protein SAMN04488105_116129 [Salipiger thiooxidans]